MSGTTAVMCVFVAGCAAGMAINAAGTAMPDLHGASLYILYALMLQVGFGIGCSDNLKKLLSSFSLRLLLFPAATIAGTLVFSALVSLLLARWSVFDCMAVGSGMGYYSLASILIVQLKEPTLGTQLATELGTIALLANIFRELLALAGAPLFNRLFGRLAPISVAGVTSGDVALPSIVRVSGQDMVPIAILHGLLIDFSVPFFISLFCGM